MYTLDYKLPFSTIALIWEADYLAKIHFNFTCFFPFSRSRLDKSLRQKRFRWIYDRDTRADARADVRACARTRMRMHTQASGCAHDSNIKSLEKWIGFDKLLRQKRLRWIYNWNMYSENEFGKRLWRKYIYIYIKNFKKKKFLKKKFGKKKGAKLV